MKRAVLAERGVVFLLRLVEEATEKGLTSSSLTARACLASLEGTVVKATALVASNRDKVITLIVKGEGGDTV
jgi:hypothetical protein